VHTSSKDQPHLLDAITRTLTKNATKIIDADVMTSSDGLVWGQAFPCRIEYQDFLPLLLLFVLTFPLSTLWCLIYFTDFGPFHSELSNPFG